MAPKSKLKAGRFLTEGADTCVFDPHLPCWSFSDFHDTPQMYATSDEFPNHVSRIVSDPVEITVQSFLKVYLERFPQFKKHFNIASEICNRIVLYEWEKKNQYDQECSAVEALRDARSTWKPFDTESPSVNYIEEEDLFNLITPKLGKLIFESVPFMDGTTNALSVSFAKTQAAMKDLLNALIDMKGKWGLYWDGHLQNIGWNYEFDALVLFDFGRVKLTKDEIQDGMMDLYEDRDSQEYSQHMYCTVAVTVFRAKNQDFLRLRPVFDVLSILGAIQYWWKFRYRRDIKEKRGEPEVLFPNIEECATEIIEFTLDHPDYKRSDIHRICNETIFV